MMSAENAPTERPSRIRVAFQLLVLLLLLVLTPAVSWLYLRKGLDYRQENLSVLAQLGQVRPGAWTDTNGESLNTLNWKDQITLVYLSGSVSQVDQRLPLLRRIQSQFSDRSDVVLIQFMDQRDWSRTSAIKDSVDWKVVVLESPELADLMTEWSQGLRQEAADRLILIDRQGQVRALFDPSDSEDVRSLVEVTAVMLPPKKVDKPTLQRESEK